MNREEREQQKKIWRIMTLSARSSEGKVNDAGNIKEGVPSASSSSVSQIIPGRLYFVSYDESLCSIPNDDEATKYLDIDDYLHYEAFFDDFGPLNLSSLYRFCQFLNDVLEDQEQRNKRLFLYTNMLRSNRVNAAYLIAAYLIIYQNFNAEQAYLRLKAAEPPQFVGFCDATIAGTHTYFLHVQHVIQSVEKSLKLGWLNFEEFDPFEYDFYEKVENGDLNWIVPGKMLGFCGPHDRTFTNEKGYPYHAPEVYFDYFRNKNVTTIVRLNKKIYDSNRFTQAGFDHHDLFFPDGTIPSDEIVLSFIRVVDSAPGAVAVHCKAGLGRTGTLIACWMMKHFRFTAPQCMGWLRICRPGSVIGPQQHFLLEKQEWCWNLGRVEKQLEVPSNEEKKREEEEEEQMASSETSQGDILCQIKAERQHLHHFNINNCTSSQKIENNNNNNIIISTSQVGEKSSTNSSKTTEKSSTTLSLSPQQQFGDNNTDRVLLFAQKQQQNDVAVSVSAAANSSSTNKNTTTTTSHHHRPTVIVKQFKLSTTIPSPNRVLKCSSSSDSHDNDDDSFLSPYLQKEKAMLLKSSVEQTKKYSTLRKSAAAAATSSARKYARRFGASKIPIQKVSVSTTVNNLPIALRSKGRQQFANSHLLDQCTSIAKLGGEAETTLPSNDGGINSFATSVFGRTLKKQYERINADAKTRQQASSATAPFFDHHQHPTNCRYELRPRNQLLTPSRFAGTEKKLLASNYYLSSAPLQQQQFRHTTISSGKISKGKTASRL